jgi:hypothetical protein
VSQPVTEPGWYRAGPRGLERVCGVDDLPDDPADLPDIAELVKVEFSEHHEEQPLW